MKAYIDKTSWNYEQAAHGGMRVYFSEKDLKENNSCIDECGYVEVEIKFIRVVQEENYDAFE
jgi:hypothetical protein